MNSIFRILNNQLELNDIVDDVIHHDVTDPPQSSQETINLSDEQAVKLYTSNEENKKNHLRIAQQLEVIFEQRWFSIDDIIKKTVIKEKKSAIEMMLALQLFTLCITRQGGMKSKHETQYKLMISLEEKLKVLEQRKQQHLKQIQLIDDEQRVIVSEIENKQQDEK